MSWEDNLVADVPRGLPGHPDNVPDASWALGDEITREMPYREGSIFVGYRDGKAVGVKDDRHVLLCAGSRAGKGVSVVIPNLMLYEGSILTIDPKGELARETAGHRAATGQKVVVLDPFNRSGDGTKAMRGFFNPLAEIDPASEEAVDDAALLADAMITDDAGTDNHWVNGARELVKALILRALLEPEATRNLAYVRKFFQAPGVPIQQGDKTVLQNGQIFLLREIAKRRETERPFSDVMIGIASAYLQKNEREFNSIVSMASVQLAFLDSKPLLRTLEKSSFKLSELKTGKTTVYLCLPASRMATHGKWFRMVVSQAMLMAENVVHEVEHPLLLLLEEFAVLGYLRSIESAAGQIAGFGVKIFTVLQDLTQLQKFYPKTWETFIGNAGAAIFFGNSDLTTLDYISKRLGVLGYDMKKKTSATPSARLAGASLVREETRQSKLLEPHEVERLLVREKLRALILRPGKTPVLAQRILYHKDASFRRLAMRKVP